MNKEALIVALALLATAVLAPTIILHRASAARAQAYSASMGAQDCWPLDARGREIRDVPLWSDDGERWYDPPKGRP